MMHYRQGVRVVEIDTAKAEYKGLMWKDLGSYGKKKFENLLFLQHSKNTEEQRLPLRFLYV